MSTCIKNHYNSEHDAYKLFEKSFPENITINKWYLLENGNIIYCNSKGYYHLVKINKNSLGYYLDDYVLRGNMELKESTQWGYFKNKKELQEFLSTKEINLQTELKQLI